jgi:MFS family permease
MTHSLRTNIRKLYVFSFLKMMLFPMAIITLFWKDHIGLSLTEIMLLQAVFSLASLCLEYPSGYISDRLGYRFALNIAALFGIVGWSLYTVAGSFWGVLVAEVLLGVSFAFISGSDSALLFETLKQQNKEHLYTRYDGRMSGFAQIGEAVGALFAGFLYSTLPLLPFFIQILIWIFALMITLSLREVTKAELTDRSHLQEMATTWLLAWRDNRRIRATILLTTCAGLASFYPVWLIQPYMQAHNLPLVWFGPVWAGANLTVALFSFISHRSAFFIGSRGMLIVASVLTLTGYLGLGLGAGIFSFLFYYLLTAMRGLQGPFLRHYLQREGERKNRASLLSLKALTFRLGFVVTAPFIGFLADGSGVQTTFLILTAPVCIAFLLSSLYFYKVNCSGNIEL